MPGIVGLITRKPQEDATSELRQMLAVMRHEPFYRSGTWCNESLGVYVGWTAVAGSFSDGMPLHNETGNIVLMFSGEEFPEPGTRDRLQRQGHAVTGDGCSYLVHLCEEDAAFPKNLNGMFHGVLVNVARGTATLFTDRYRMHRLYYHESKDTFYFAAEAKAILEVCPELRSADLRGIGEFITCGCVLEDRTLFKEIEVLPGAAWWTFCRGLMERKERYFKAEEWEQQPRLDREYWYATVRRLFSQNLPRYFDGHQPIAVSLTGGLDTRTIMAWRKAQPRSLPCYTFGGMYRECQDVQVARRVAIACGQDHHVISVGEEFLSRFPHYAERTVYLTDGCASVSRSPDLYVNERARHIAQVRMTGLFGDEVLRYNRTFKPSQQTAAIFSDELRSYARVSRQTYTEALKVHPLSFSVYRQAPWHQYGSLALERSQVEMRTPFLDNDLVRAAFRAPESTVASKDYRLRLIEDGDSVLRSIRTDRALDSRDLYGNAMRLVQGFTFKAEYAYDYGMPQWVAKIDHFFSALHLERLFLGRHKFYHFRVWYRDILSDYVREILLDPRTLCRPYLDRKAIRAVVQNHIEGKRNYTTEIHQALTLELIHRLFLDSR